jgi:hypothetical protein
MGILRIMDKLLAIVSDGKRIRQEKLFIKLRGFSHGSHN